MSKHNVRQSKSERKQVKRTIAQFGSEIPTPEELEEMLEELRGEPRYSVTPAPAHMVTCQDVTLDDPEVERYLDACMIRSLRTPGVIFS